LPKPPDNEALNKAAIDALALDDDIESKVGQHIPMSYEGTEYEILLQGVSKHTEVNKAAKTCYDYNISRDGVTLGVADFIRVETDRHGCTID